MEADQAGALFTVPEISTSSCFRNQLMKICRFIYNENDPFFSLQWGTTDWRYGGLTGTKTRLQEELRWTDTVSNRSGDTLSCLTSAALSDVIGQMRSGFLWELQQRNTSASIRNLHREFTPRRLSQPINSQVRASESLLAELNLLYKRCSRVSSWSFHVSCGCFLFAVILCLFVFILILFAVVYVSFCLHWQIMNPQVFNIKYLKKNQMKTLFKIHKQPKTTKTKLIIMKFQCFHSKFS